MTNKTEWKCQGTLGLALLLSVGLTLVCGEAHASVTGLGLGLGGGLGGLGGGALASLIGMIKANIAQVASLGVLALGMAYAFAKSGWMELIGALAFIVTLGITVTWTAGQTQTFFGTGALL